MAITSSIATSFKQQMLAGTQVISSNTFKVALYNSSAVLGPSTTAYTVTNECTGTNYTAGGVVLTGASVFTDTTTVGITFSNPTFTNITITDIRGMMIYNSTNANSTVAVFDFGQSIGVTGANFTILIPNATAITGLIRFT